MGTVYEGHNNGTVQTARMYSKTGSGGSHATIVSTPSAVSCYDQDKFAHSK
jgi:hypothetical protein